MYTVLLIEDLPAVRSYLVRLLQEYPEPLRVLEAGNGMEAMELAEGLEADLLLTDIFMPFMDGFTFLENFRKKKPEIKTIIISAYDDFEYAKKAITLMANGYLLKPVKKRELYEELDRLLRELEDQRGRRRELDSLLEEKRRMETASLLQELILGRTIQTELQGVWALFLLRTAPEALKECPPEEIAARRGCFSPGSRQLCSLQTNRHWETVLLYAGEGKGLLESQAKSFTEALCEEFRARNQPFYVSVSIRVGAFTQCREAYQEAGKLMHLRYLTEALQAGFLTSPVPGPDSGKRTEILDDLEQLQLLCRFSERGELGEGVQNAFHRLWETAGLTYREVSVFFRRLRELYCAACDSLGIGFPEQEAALPQLEPAYYVDRLHAEEGVCRLFACLREEHEECAESSAARMANYLKNYLDKNFAEPVHLHELASLLYLNVDYLGRLFREQTGESFLSYLTGRRMACARELVCGTCQSITEIAGRAGYNSTSNFISTFRRTFGVTPAAMRARQAAGKPEPPE